ncbi:hypothetical protein [Moorena producens]|uniref:hypothetical protein n=1 Tax=Moorena producens TaxID=1155739 RepID=UPI003C770D75
MGETPKTALHRCKPRGNPHSRFASRHPQGKCHSLYSSLAIRFSPSLSYQLYRG